MNRFTYVEGNPLSAIDPYGLQAGVGIGGAAGGFGGLGGFGGAAGGSRGGYDPRTDRYIPPTPSLADLLQQWTFAKPPENAYDPNGPKAPGKPGEAEGFKYPKGGENWVPNPNGRGYGWEAKDGGVWCPTGSAGSPGSGTSGPAHGGPHWDVQYPGGGGFNMYPGGKRRDR